MSDPDPLKGLAHEWGERLPSGWSQCGCCCQSVWNKQSADTGCCPVKVRALVAERDALRGLLARAKPLKDTTALYLVSAQAFAASF